MDRLNKIQETTIIYDIYVKRQMQSLDKNIAK